MNERSLWSACLTSVNKCYQVLTTRHRKTKQNYPRRENATCKGIQDTEGVTIINQDCFRITISNFKHNQECFINSLVTHCHKQNWIYCNNFLLFS